LLGNAAVPSHLTLPYIVAPQMWPGAMSFSSSTICALVAVYFHNRAQAIYTGEIRNGFYPPGACLVSSTIISIPCLILMAATTIFGNLYGIGGWNISASPQMLYITFVLLFAFETAAKMCSLIKNPLIGMLAFIQYW
jgi:hypothetical protein